MIEKKRSPADERTAEIFQYHRLFTTTPDFVALVNRQYRYLMVNEAYEKAFGKPAEEIVGCSVAELQGQELFDNVLKDYYDRAAMGETISYARWYDLPALGRRYLSVTMHPAPDAGGEISIIAINAHDITEQVKSEEYMRMIFDTSLDLLSVVGFDGLLKRFNPSWSLVLGWTEEELENRRLLELMHPDDVENVRMRGRALQAGEQMASFEFRMRDKQGSYHTLSWNAFPDTERQEIFAVARDITEQKAIERTLKESEIRYRALFDESPVALMEQDFSAVRAYIDQLKARGVGDLNDYLLDNPAEVRELAARIKVAAVNQAAADLYGSQNVADMIGKPVQFFAPESYEDFRKEVVSLARGARRFSHEIKRQTIAGKPLELILDLNLAQGYEESWGKVFVSMIDITARKHAERALLASEKKYRTIFDSAGDAILVQELEGKFLDVNSVACQLLGYERDELLAMTSQEIESSIMTVKTSLILRRVFSQGQVHLETSYRRKDGVEIPVWVSLQYFIYDGAPALLQIMRDISERKRLEDELKMLATLDSLTSVNNRRHFLELAELELKRSRRYHKNLALLLIDVDYFKSVNDTYGHAAGDDALRALADKCLVTLRSTDLFGRLGGEEFAAILVETDAEAAQATANRLRQAVAEMAVHSQGETIRFTVSIGVALLDGQDINLDRLMKRADIALYEAKRSGRNRVCLG